MDILKCQLDEKYVPREEILVAYGNWDILMIIKRSYSHIFEA